MKDKKTFLGEYQPVLFTKCWLSSFRKFCKQSKNYATVDSRIYFSRVWPSWLQRHLDKPQLYYLYVAQVAQRGLVYFGGGHKLRLCCIFWEHFHLSKHLKNTCLPACRTMELCYHQTVPRVGLRARQQPQGKSCRQFISSIPTGNKPSWSFSIQCEWIYVLVDEKSAQTFLCSIKPYLTCLTICP